MQKVIFDKYLKKMQDIRAEIGTGFVQNPYGNMQQIADKFLLTLPNEAQYEWIEQSVSSDVSGIQRRLLVVQCPYLTLKENMKTVEMIFVFVIYSDPFKSELLTYCTNI